MVIKKILNNNVVVCDNNQGIEQIVCGKGIAFKNKVGNKIDESLINKVYELKSEKTNKRFQEIIANFSLDFIELSDKIVEMIKLELGQKISDSIYITLTDHLYTAIQRAKAGIFMPNTMLWEIKNYYEPEYKIAQKVIDIVKENTGISLKDDESGFIALHIVNSETENSRIEETMEITKIVQSIVKVVRVYFQTDFNTESVYFYRFVTHLKFFAQRLVYHKTYNSNESDGLLDMVKTKYKAAYKCTEKVAEMIFKKYNYTVLDEEKLYLTIHIQRIVFKNNG